MSVSVVGVGQTEYRVHEDLSIPELVTVAVEEALADAGMKLSEVRSVVTSSIDLFDGKTASNVYLTEVVGAVMKPEARIADDGIAALIHGAMALRAGAYENCLVVAHCKESEGERRKITNFFFDPLHQQPLGVDDVSAAALQADLWLRSWGQGDATLGERAMDRAAARSARNGRKNPKTPLAQEMGDTEESVWASPYVARPLRQRHISPVCDGACALLLAKDGSGFKAPVTIAGFGHAVEPHYLGDRDLPGCAALKEAAQRAAAMAGSRPVDVWEVSAPFAHQELLWSEALGGAPQDRLNPSGGVLAGNPYVVAGLARAAECVLQLRGKAGQRQIPGVRRALAHGCWGPCGQGHGIAILEV